jgi:hypothetical protein
MIVLKRTHDRHPIRNYTIRLAVKIAIGFFLLACVLLFGCDSGQSERSCRKPYQGCYL